MSQDLQIRRLTYADLPQVIAIERRAFPTPWSLAMFVLELSKPSGICLAAIDRRADRRLPGLLALRHGLARDERGRRRPAAAAEGIATALMERLFEQADKPNEQYTLEVRTSNDAGDPPLRDASASGRPGAGAPTTTTTARTP